MQEKRMLNSAFTTYEDTYDNLEKAVNKYLSLTTEKELEEFIKTKQKGRSDGSKNHFQNRLANIPNGNIKQAIKDAYLTGNDLEGILGTGDPEDQEIGIEQTALLMLMYNRLSKKCDGPEKREYYLKKDRAMKDLIASLYIIEKTGGEDYENKYSYGINEDEERYDALCIDLPYIGQIGIHFGHKRDSIIADAKNTAKSILEKKQELGEISKEELEVLQEDIKDDILPEYTGCFFEGVSAIPIPYNRK